MAKPSRGELEKLMDKAGIGARTKKKMHAANGTDEASTPAASKPSRPRGHGASAPTQLILDEL